MDWNDEYIAHVCKLFAQQVLRGNRPNTHLNAVGYDEVIAMFKQITGVVVLQTTAGWRKAPALAQRVCTRG